MAGYNGTPSPTELGIKPGCRLQLRGARADVATVLGTLPEGVVKLGPRARAADCVILFSTSVRSVTESFARAAALLPPAGMLWVAWPKRTSGVRTDLTEAQVRRIGLAGGLVDVKVCAIDEVWSGLKFVRRLKDR